MNPKKLTRYDLRTGYAKHADPRREKRFSRDQNHPVYLAWIEGQAAAMYGHRIPKRLQANPCRPGRRRDEWQRGYDLAV